MDQLPLALTHGHLIWIFGLCTCLFLGVVYCVVSGRWRTRRLQRRLTKEHSAQPNDDPRGQVVSLVGVIGGERLCERIEDGAPVAVTTAWGCGYACKDRAQGLAFGRQAGVLWLEVAGERIQLEGDAVALLGSDEVLPRRWRWLSPAAKRRVLESSQCAELGRFPPHLRVALSSVQPGDRVQATGLLRRRPLETGYRSSAGRLTLGPHPTERRLELVCLDHISPRPRIRWGRAAWLGFSLFFLSFGVGGSCAFQAAEDDDYWWSNRRDFPNALLVAAVAPHHRQTILRRLAGRHRHSRPSTKEQKSLVMALLELGGTCQERIAVLRELGRPRKAIQLWRACPPDPHVSSWLGEMAWAYFDLGQFGRASALLDTANLSWYGQKEAEVHALAGRYESAARILDDWASRGEHELASWELHCTKRPVRKHLVYWCKSDEPLRKEARRLRCLTNTVSDLGWTSNRWRAAPCTPTRLREEPDVIKGRLVKTLGKGKSVGFRRRLAARLATLERLVALTLVRSAF